MTSRLALLAAFVLTCTGSALAQTEPVPLRAGDKVEGALSGATTNIANVIDCYLLETVAGSLWEMELRGDSFVLSIGEGRNCEKIFQQWHLVKSVDDHGRVSFVAGGGVYLVRVGRAGGSGNYTLTARENPNGKSKLSLPPGLKPLPPLIAGTASTAAPSPSAASFTPGQTFRDCDICPEMVVLPVGRFMMGSPETEEGRTADEGPMHPVTIGRPFAMGKLEVTFEQYEACVAVGDCEASRSDQGWGRGSRPVIGIGYRNALHYVAWLSAKTGAQYFVPSEAEWEYAARAGTTTPWNTGTAIITADANFLKTFGKTVPAGSYPPNAFGLHDMHGNVFEWTQDCMDAGYLGVPVDGSAAILGVCANKRIVRGGAYLHPHNFVRSAKRLGVSETAIFMDVGFRVARAL